MAQTQAKLEIAPEIIRKLSAAKSTLWTAAHGDGSDNRINVDSVMETAAYSTSLGILNAIGQWFRKKHRNRDKTREDLQAEKEAVGINQACDALEEMMLEYLQAAQKGIVEEESLDDLIGKLEEIQGYECAGKLKVAEKEVAEIGRSLAGFTASLTGQPGKAGGGVGGIRDMLLRQKAFLAARA